ncbi:MAG: C40 family peptidase [Gemmatimonadetes bacterium]|nr:C40 family peptidase [Gemmatimonadota bacterium]
MELMERLRAVISEVRHEHAPDPRLAIYEVMVIEDGVDLRVVGATSEPAALEALRRRIGLIEEARSVQDEVQRYPELPQDGAGIHALVSSAVVPLLSGPFVAEPHVSQAILGQHLTVLRERGRWLHVRAEDGYLGWMHRGYVHRVNEAEAREWALGGARGETSLSLGAELRDGRGEVVARLPWGARIHCDGSRGFLPNGLAGDVVGEVIPASERRERFPTHGNAVAETTARWLGVPYIWSGVTLGGADCSGFVQAIYRMHGVELPRDSDQQSMMGEAVDPEADFSGLLPGDLLFFAEDPGRVSHVTISLGGSRIIHSSLGNGGVRRNDLLGASSLEEELRRLFYGARRLIPLG